MRFKEMPLARAEMTASAICCSPRARARTARSSRYSDGSLITGCRLVRLASLGKLVGAVEDLLNGPGRWTTPGTSGERSWRER